MTPPNNVRVRFAPSPTGELHIGNARAALYNYLFAKHHHGTFIVRLEDTDRERLVPGSAQRILEVLTALHIVPDEGVQLGNDGTIVQVGDLGPYIQSERLAIYQEMIVQLIAAGHAYYCFCTPERLEKMREEQMRLRVKIGYDGHCRAWTPDDVARAREAGTPAVVRMRMPETGEVSFDDIIRGTITFSYADVEDYVLMKSDGFPTYHFANVVDDHLMHITHVIRGEEWISSTPKHVALYRAFGWEHPQFAHLPLLLNPDRSKLSKRQGDVAAIDYLKKGYLPEAIVNFIALLGWNPRGDQEIYTLQELVEQFDLSKVNKSGAVFNREKLDWLNHHYIQLLSDEDLAARIEPYLREKGLYEQDPQRALQIVHLEKQRISTLAQAGEETAFLFHPITPKPEQLVWKKSTSQETKEVLRKLTDVLTEIPEEQWTTEGLERYSKQWIADQGLSTGTVLWPMRVALSGKEQSPDPFTLAVFHGKETTLALLERSYAVL